MLPWCCYPICAKVLSAAGTLFLQSAMRAPMCHTITVRHLQAQPLLLFSMHRSHWLKWDFYMFKGSRIGAAPANDPCLHSWGQKWKLLTFKQHHWDSLHHIFHPFLVLCSQLLSSSRRAQLFFNQGVTKLFFRSVCYAVVLGVQLPQGFQDQAPVDIISGALKRRKTGFLTEKLYA